MVSIVSDPAKENANMTRNESGRHNLIHVMKYQIITIIINASTFAWLPFELIKLSTVDAYKRTQTTISPEFQTEHFCKNLTHEFLSDVQTCKQGDSVISSDTIQEKLVIKSRLNSISVLKLSKHLRVKLQSIYVCS
jgi:hypothetical protein